MARAVLLAPMLLALLLAAACGGGDDPGDTGDAGSRQGERRSDATVFTWESSDGVEIEAELRRGGPDWVLLGHQFTGSRRDWDPMVEGFAERGYTVLFWDFRCHGESGCNTVDGSKREATQDIWREWVAALDYAVANGARRIHAGGASMGGTSLIQVAAGRDDIDTIFAISSPNRFQGLDALERYDQVTVPMLFIVGAGDKAAPDFSQRYFDRAEGPARLNILNTELHGATLAKDGVWGRLVQPMLYEFVADPEGYIAAGGVNNLTAAPAPDEPQASPEEESAAQAEAEAPPADELAEDPPDGAAEAPDAPLEAPPTSTGPPPSGYALALIAPGDGGDVVVVTDPFRVEDFLITRQFEGRVEEITWLATRAGVLVGLRDRIVALDLTTDPPAETTLAFDFLPEGIAPDFFNMGLSRDGIVLSFAVVPAGDDEAPSTPALVNLLGPTLQAPFAGARSGTPRGPGVPSPDDRVILAQEEGALLLLAPAGFEVEARYPAPEIEAADELCLDGACMALEYSTDFPHEFEFIRASTTGAFWVAYTNKIYVGLPDEAELQEWVTLPGIPTDIAVSPRGDRIAWVSAGPPEGSNRLLVSDTGSAETLVLLEDPSLVFFDLQWSTDARYLALSSLNREERAIGVLVIDVVSGEVFPIGVGCCAVWAPFISES
ncbi:MAG: hypothetical protein OXI03_05785 [Chloroflexota bacterium]|nr:hypothetical protein [Chloroflexota bacterium]